MNKYKKPLKLGIVLTLLFLINYLIIIVTNKYN